jgi:predicted transcriptional regulator of viral defense system
MRPRQFFASRPVFTHGEFVAAHTEQGRSRNTSNAILAQYVAAGKLTRIRKGLYAAVPPGVDPQKAMPDPYLVATHAKDDAVIGYHSALEFHGKAYSVWSRVQYVTASRVRPFSFRGSEFVGIQASAPVRRLDDFGGGVLRRPHAGGQVRVTSLERSLVDLLHSPARGGGWEETWRSLELVEFFDLEAVARFTIQLGSALTSARVGLFLELHAQELMVEEKHLQILEARSPGQPRYLDGRRRPGTFVPRWNLVVPEFLLQRQWEEMG